MLAPTSPKKKPDELNELLDGLSVEYGLSFPPKDERYSPSRRPSPEKAESAIVGHLRFLYYRDQNALRHALDRFHKDTASASTNWVWKPKADPGVLPSSKPRKTTVPPMEAQAPRFVDPEDVAATLLQNLNDTSALVMAGKSHEIPQYPQTRGRLHSPLFIFSLLNLAGFLIAAPALSSVLPKPSHHNLSRQSSLSQVSKRSKNHSSISVSPLGATNVPPSNEFLPDSDTTAAMEGINIGYKPAKLDLSLKHRFPEPPTSSEEDYATAPSTPSKSPSQGIVTI